MCDFTLKDTLESLASVLYEGELESEKLIDIKEMNELILAIKKIEKVMLRGKRHTSFEEIAFRQLHECYYSLGKDG